jgi:UDP-glucose 4-epimerase
MSLCLVTGGAGFIGSHLAEGLLRRGHRVRVLDDLSTGDRANLGAVEDEIEFTEGDITDLETVQKATRGCEFVFHQAALASVPRSVANPLATHRACVDGTLHVLLAARDAGVRRVVYAASSSAYGNSQRSNKSEADPTAPLSPYAVAKLAGEQYCAAFSEVYRLETVRLRYFNVFGPRQSPASAYAAVIPLFIDAIGNGRSPVVHGDGHQSRDFTFVADVVQANIRAATAEGVSGRVYNVACGKQTTLLTLLDAINAQMGKQVAPTFSPSRPGDVKHSLADIRRACDELGYLPTTDVSAGLARCIEWWRQRSAPANSRRGVGIA